jgi:hypothetical protein
MADLPGFRPQALLAPIPGDVPQLDIREDFAATSAYNRLRDARSRRVTGARAGRARRKPAIPPAWRTVRCAES